MIDRKRSPTNTGGILKRHYLELLAVVISQAAVALGVSRKTVSTIVNGSHLNEHGDKAMNYSIVSSAFLFIALALTGCATPFQKAVVKGDTRQVIAFLDKGADANELLVDAKGKSYGGLTILMQAVLARQPEVVEILLTRGAGIDQQDADGDTALSLAARNGSADVVKVLLAHGADVSLPDNEGLTALSWAEKYGYEDIVKMLVERGADLHVTRAGTVPGAAKSHDQSALVSSPRQGKAQNDKSAALVSVTGSKPSAAMRVPDGKNSTPTPDEDASHELPEAAPRPPARVSDVDRPTYKLVPRPADYALIVGVEKYSKLPAASFAESDAAAVRKHLEAMGLPPRNIMHLKGQAATRGALQGYIEEWLPKNVKPESTLFFYYSGHGAPDPKTGEAFLVPWDGDAMFLQSTAYPLKQLYSSLAKLKAKEIVIALDSCFSGAGGRSVLAAGTRPLVTKVAEGVVPRGNITLFAAASGDEITGSLDEQGHGMFTYYFLKGLGGAAKNSTGAVTAQGLHEYLKPHVQDEASRQNREQTPTLVGQKDRTISQF